MHPLIGDLSQLKDNELELKINELSKKYFSTYNVDVRQQIVMVLDSYKEELNNRRRQEYEKMMQSRDKNLDKLINVD